MKKIVLAFVLAIMAFASHADELLKLIDNKQVEYAGVCRFDKNDMLTFTEASTDKVVKCVVGFVPGEPDDLKYVLVYYNNEPVFLVEYSKVRRAQRVIWRKPSI